MRFEVKRQKTFSLQAAVSLQAVEQPGSIPLPAVYLPLAEKTVGILIANLAESGNDRASGPTIRTRNRALPRCSLCPRAHPPAGCRATSAARYPPRIKQRSSYVTRRWFVQKIMGYSKSNL